MSRITALSDRLTIAEATLRAHAASAAAFADRARWRATLARLRGECDEIESELAAELRREERA